MVSRRRILAGASGAAAALTGAGCLDRIPSEAEAEAETSSYPLNLRNRTDRPVTVELAIARDGEVVHEDEYEIPDGERVEAGVELAAGGRYSVETNVVDGPWDVWEPTVPENRPCGTFDVVYDRGGLRYVGKFCE